MTERKLPNLPELDRLERERRTPATTDPPYGIRVLSIDDLNFLGDQLRPLLDLVDRLGKAFAPLICKSAPTEAEVNAAITVLAEYRRAKGGK